MEKVKRKRIWEKSWICTLGIVALSGSLVFTETSVAYGAPRNVPLKNVQEKESVKTEQLPVEEYLLQCWEKKQERIDMKPYKITMEQLNSVIFNLHYEKPELYWVLRNQAFEVNKETGLLETYVQHYEGRNGQPLDRSEELEQEWEIVKNKTDKCKTDLEKAIVVHDHLCETISYSENHYEITAHDIEGAILEKRAVCEGYSLAYKYYMNRLGIPCNVIEGVAGASHAWNQIKINGKWYLVDVTWDDSRDNSTKHQYFLSSENTFDQHTWNKEDYEICNNTTYDNAPWRNNKKVIYSYEGGIYYSDGKIDPSTGKFESGIFRYDAENTETTDELVIPIDDGWKEDVNTSGMAKGASELAYYKENLYYNTPKAIWKWNFQKNAKPEKVLELSSDIKGDIWDISIDGGTLCYETAEGERGQREYHEYEFDKNYQKTKHPIAVTKNSMTVELNGQDVFLQGAAPGKLSYTSKDPEICETNVVWKDESCQLIPKKAGETQVVVRAEETNRYLAGEVLVNIKVVDKGASLEHYEIQATSPKTITYGDEETVDIKIVNIDTGEEINPSNKDLTVRPSKNITYTNGKITATDVGEYNLTITANDMREIIVKGTVTKRKATVKADSIERNKKDKHIEPTVTIENLATFDKSKDFGIVITCDVNPNTPIGKYPITVSGGNEYFLSHYEPTYVNGSYKILGIQNVILHYEAGENGSLRAVKAGTDVELKNGLEIEPNTEVKFTATPKNNYIIKNWIINGKVHKIDEKVYTGNTLSHVITSSNDSVKVEFVKEKKSYRFSTKAVYEDGSLSKDIAITVKNEDGNIVTSESDILEGTKITAETNCPPNMSIVKWVINGKEYPSEDTISFILNSNTEVKLVIRQENWVLTESGWEYYENGQKAVGWKEISGEWYYFNKNAIMQTGWVFVNSHWYYMNESGAMETGWVSVNGHWYYMDQWGAMQTGWVFVNDHWYYMDQWGAMQTGWVSVNSHWYYMDQWGAMQTGWVSVNDHWYYMDQWGAMQTGWIKFEGNWYYLNSDGIMMESSWLNEYYFNANGLWSSPYIHLEKMQVSQKVSQIIFVETKGTHAQVSMHIKQADGNWYQLLRDNGRIGYGGLGKQKEGDKKTPAGCFSLDEIFGIAPNPGAILPYLQVNKGHYWVGDNNSPYYNSLVNVNEIGYVFNTNVSEHIISYGNVYNYCIAIGYNKEKIPYKGSAIFLHCSGAGATAGCVSVPEDTMIRIIQNIKDDAVIIIDTPSNMQKY